MMNDETTIYTGGGVAVGNNVDTGGGAFVGRDQINFIVPLGNWEEVHTLLFQDQSRTTVATAMREQFQTFDWAKAEQAYLAKLIKLYDRVRILGSSADVPLGDVFTQVYILDKPTARRRHDIEELRKERNARVDFQRQPGERIHGTELVKTGQNLFILGKPGAGKTTFLKYITVQAAHQQLPRIPIFVSLNQWADSQWGKGNKAALLPFLVEQFDICGFPDAALFIEYLLRTARALVLFDGLDEVKQEKDQRRQLTRLLQDFACKYDKAQQLITCRIAASDYTFAGFADVEVADFTPDQVREYAHHWFNDAEKKFATFTDELAKPENQGLAELCNTPLLLSLLCLTFDNDMRFPPSRAELYEDALEILLRKWDSSRAIQRDEIYRALSYKRKLQLLMRIAVTTFERGDLFFRQRDLEGWIVDYLAKLPGAPPADTLDGAVILKAIEAQHSILIERTQGIYSFSHLTFQEYLTARSLAENQGNAVTESRLRDHVTDPRWREVFLLTASLLTDAEGFINALRLAIDSLVANIPRVMHLLIWAHDRSQHTNSPVELRAFVQNAYIFLDLDFALASDLTLTRSLNGNLTDIYELVRKLAHEIAHYRGFLCSLGGDRSVRRAIDGIFAVPSDSVPKPALDFAFSHWLASTNGIITNQLLGLDYGLYFTWSNARRFAYEQFDRTDTEWQTAIKEFPDLVKGVMVLAYAAGLADVAQQLNALLNPFISANRQEWQRYAELLTVILRDKRDLGHKWNLNHEESNKLKAYYYTNELLIQCLKVAAVSDREAVLRGLLLPPKADKMAE